MGYQGDGIGVRRLVARLHQIQTKDIKFCVGNDERLSCDGGTALLILRALGKV